MYLNMGFFEHIYLSDKMQVMILAGGFLAIFFAILCIFKVFSVEKRVHKKHSSKKNIKKAFKNHHSEKNSKQGVQYMEWFREYWNESYDIKAVLEKVLPEYKSGSQEGKVIKRALDYLDNSYMKDYQTALKFIDEYFNEEDIRLMHQECMRYMIEKKLQNEIE